jgi:hypothetical protein
MSNNSSDGDIENLLFIIADLPDFLKLSICRTKVKELVEMTESEKKETMIRTLTSINLINREKLVNEGYLRNRTRSTNKYFAQLSCDFR